MSLVRTCVLWVKTQVQHLWITSRFFFTNGLANHAAAGAFGFLLSVTPVLLLTAFLLAAAFRSSPQAIHALIQQIPFFEIAFDEEWLANEFLAFSRSGLSVFLSLLTVFWAGRIFAVSLQRGLKIIFTGTKKRIAVIDNLLCFLIETLALVFAAVMVLFSRMSLQFFDFFNYLPDSFIAFASNTRLQIFRFAALWLISYCAFRIASANAPSRRSALLGSLFTIIFFLLLSTIFNIIINQTSYYFLYGVLGNLIILLLNVYFFFVFFFYGAQLAFVIDNFDKLLFIQFRQARETDRNLPSRNRFKEKLFYHVNGKLEKYLRNYTSGEIIFKKGDERKEVFYLLDGEVEVLISSAGNTGTMIVSRLTSSFFGEMGHFLSEDRSATVMAKTAVSVLALPPALFDEVLKHDHDLDRAVLEQLSQRLKDSNEKINTLTAAGKT